MVTSTRSISLIVPVYVQALHKQLYGPFSVNSHVDKGYRMSLLRSKLCYEG